MTIDVNKKYMLTGGQIEDLASRLALTGEEVADKAEKAQTGSTAPTTSTPGEIGQLYIQSDGTVYILKSIVEESGQPDEYTWEEVGGGVTYTAGTGLALNGTQFSVDTTAIATQSDLTAGLATKQDTLTAGANIQINNNTISATNTTYSDFTGTDGTTAGTAGLVPAPATTDAGKFLKADGTWDTAGGGGGPTVVQTTGSSTTNVMSQNAVSSMVFSDVSAREKVQIGNGAVTLGAYSVAIGSQADTSAYNYGVAIGGGTVVSNAAHLTGNGGVAIGYSASATNNAVAVGSYANATAQGEFAIGASSNRGYNNSAYRLLTGLYDGQNDHDAATYGQVVSYAAINGAGAPTTATEGRYVGQLYYDTTNEAMYFLKAIDTTTTPATYTWVALGGGGSSTTIRTTTDGVNYSDVSSLTLAGSNSVNLPYAFPTRREDNVQEWGYIRPVIGLSTISSAYVGGYEYDGDEDIWSGKQETRLALYSDVHDATLTIQQNGATVDTFSANASTNKTVNIETPATFTTNEWNALWA